MQHSETVHLTTHVAPLGACEMLHAHLWLMCCRASPALQHGASPPGLQVSKAEAKALAPRYVVVTGMSAAEDVQDVTE